MSEEPTRAQRVLDALPEPTRSSLEALLNVPLVDTAELAGRVRSYRTEIGKHVGHTEIVDHWTGNTVAWKCMSLLERLDCADEEGRRLIQAAVLYFIKSDDGEDDLDSPEGFDDDLQVVDVVAKVLGFDDIVNRQGA